MESFRIFFSQLLPFVYVLSGIALLCVLIYVVMLLHRIIKITDELNPTIRTVQTISNTVDTGFKAGGKAVAKSIGKAKGVVSSIREVLNQNKRQNNE